MPEEYTELAGSIVPTERKPVKVYCDRCGSAMKLDEDEKYYCDNCCKR